MQASEYIDKVKAERNQLRAEKAELLDVAIEVEALEEYIEDFGQLGGGAMREKYGDDPMEGYNYVVKRFKRVSKQAREAIAKATASESGAV